MPVLLQITLGTALLLLCASQHIFLTSRVILRLNEHVKSHKRFKPGSDFILTALIFLIFLASHTLHLYIWAFAVWLLGALPGYESSIYFSLVTYTTVGYGDVTLGEDFRIFGAMASVTGILLFGVTTAFLVGFFTQLIKDAEQDD
jgi:hypothetical protein